MRIRKLLIIYLVSIVFFSCKDRLALEDIKDPVAQEAPSLPSIGDYEASPIDPGRDGGYDVCHQDYTLSDEYSIGETTSTYWRDGTIYYPAKIGDDGMECVPIGRFPLVTILHADNDWGGDLGYETYRDLMEHIASHGFVVQAYHRNLISGKTSQGQNLFLSHLKYLYNDDASDVKGYATGDIALVGHSAGGSSLTKIAPLISIYNGNLKAVVAMSPTVYDEYLGLGNAYDESEYTPAFLGICSVYDLDEHAYGKKNNGEEMQTAFKHYDEFGTKNGAMYAKDMLLFKYNHNGSTIKHYYENTIFAKAYITGFLMQHVKGQKNMGAFFKFQMIPSSVASNPSYTIKQLHYDSSYSNLADFENGSVTTSTNGADIISSNVTTTLYNSIDDDFSPHNTHCMKIEWDVQNGAPSVQFNMNQLNTPENLYGKYLSFNVSQLYSGIKPEDIELAITSFNLTLRDSNDNTSSINIKDFGGNLHYPFIHTPYIDEDHTKNAMRSYIIPINKFTDVDLKNIKSVSFEFTDLEYTEGTIILDDVAFTY